MRDLASVEAFGAAGFNPKYGANWRGKMGTCGNWLCGLGQTCQTTRPHHDRDAA